MYHSWMFNLHCTMFILWKTYDCINVNNKINLLNNKTPENSNIYISRWFNLSRISLINKPNVGIKSSTYKMITVSISRRRIFELSFLFLQTICLKSYFQRRVSYLVMNSYFISSAARYSMHQITHLFRFCDWNPKLFTVILCLWKIFDCEIVQIIFITKNLLNK